MKAESLIIRELKRNNKCIKKKCQFVFACNDNNIDDDERNKKGHKNGTKYVF